MILTSAIDIIQVQNVWAIATPLLVHEFRYVEICSDFENDHQVSHNLDIFFLLTVALSP